MAWTSSALLTRLRQYTGRPTTDGDLSDTLGYELLSAANQFVTHDLAPLIPHLMRTTPVQLTADADEKVYSLPAGAWLSHLELTDGPGGLVLVQGAGWHDDGADYVVESEASVRMTGDRSRSFSEGLYARYIPAPGDISAETAPTLVPERARLLIVFKAAELYALRGGHRDPSAYRQMYFDARDKLIEMAQPMAPWTGGGVDLWTRSPDLG